jgi:hypothetical protein
VSVRFASRFIKASVVEVIRTFLAEYAWTGDNPPFGTDTVTLHATAPTPSTLRAIDGNAVYVSFGSEDDNRPMQLGGGLLRQEFAVFVDVIGVDETIADCLASDIKDRLSGLFGGTRYLRPVNPGLGTVLPGYLGEFTDVARHSPDAARRNWVTVSCSLDVDFPGEES